MTTKPILPEATLQRVLAHQRRPMRARQIDGIVAARLASGFAEGLTLVAGAILGLRAEEVQAGSGERPGEPVATRARSVR